MKAIRYLSITLLLLLVVVTVNASEINSDPLPEQEAGEAACSLAEASIAESQTASRVSKVESDSAQMAMADCSMPSNTSEEGSTALSTVILTEGFEGAFPGPWTVYDYDGYTNGEYYWDDDDFKPHTGSWSGWPANGGANALDPQWSPYPNNMNSWMVYGPFDLSDATAAVLDFWFWNSSELGLDFFKWMASDNGTNFYGYQTSGYTGAWLQRSFDLTSVPTLGNLTGDSSVWIAFVADSNPTYWYQGAFIDDIVLSKNVVSQLPDLVVSQPAPSAVGPYLEGQSVDWSVTSSNIGQAAAEATEVGYYLGASCSDLSNRINSDVVGPLNPGATEDDLDPYTFVAADAGTRYMVAYVDYPQTVTESNENNNTNCYGPFTVDALPSFELDVDVIPAGAGSVTADPPPNAAGGEYSQGTVVTLTAVEDNAVYMFDNWSGDIGGATATDNPIQVVMTQDRNIDANFSEKLYPDLIVSTPSPSVQPQFYEGQSVTWRVTSTNQGGADSVQTMVGYYLGTSCSDFSNLLVGDAVMPLAPGASENDNAVYDFTAADVGTRYLNAWVDYVGQVDEGGNENNNKSCYGPFEVGPAGIAVLRVDPSDAQVPLGGGTTVDIVVENITDLYGVQLELHFDPAVVEVVWVTEGTCPTPDFVAENVFDNTAGTINFAATSQAPTLPCDGGTVMRVRFRGLALATDSPLQFDSWLLSNGDGEALTTTAQDGTLTVVDQLGTIAGRVLLQGRTDFSGATVCADDGGTPVCMTTAADGLYSINLPASSYTVAVDMPRYLDAEKLAVPVTVGTTTSLLDVTCLGGDAVEDCIINIQDLSLMGGRFNSSCGDPAWDSRADINDDCTVNILDLTMAGGNFNATCPVPWLP